MTTHGKFIVFEGIDGTGKTSLQTAVKDYFIQRGKNVLCVRDPGATVIGDKIRQLLLDPQNTAIAPLTEILLYCASRAQLLSEIILPHLQHGGYVISDRFYFSTLAYQGVHNFLPRDDLRNLVISAAGNLAVDFAFLLDAPANVCMQRLKRQHDRMEQRGVDYLENVRQEYLRLFTDLHAEKSCIISAEQTTQTVQTQVLARLDLLNW